MIINRNGIELDVRVSGSQLSYKVVNQSEEATRILRLMGHIKDKDTGLSLRTNKKPSYNKTLKRMFLRGTDAEKNNVRVKIDFDSAREAEAAVDGLARLLDRVREEEAIPSSETRNNGKPRLGCTSHFRFCFINRAMATILKLTGHEHYPERVWKWQECMTPFVRNKHWIEHARQGCSVMNKTLTPPSSFEDDKVIYPERVSPEAARWALGKLRECFKEANDLGESHLVAWWRLVTFIRGIDDLK